jgi:hypothetical protein
MRSSWQLVMTQSLSIHGAGQVVPDIYREIVMKQAQKVSYSGRWSERDEKLPSLAQLEARMRNNSTAVRIAREELIEELGTHMCGGGGGGPTQKKIRAFNHISRIGRKNQRDLTDLVSVPLMRRLVQPNVMDKR